MALNEQQKFWIEQYAEAYISKNSDFDAALGVQGWKEMLRKPLEDARPPSNILECGSNIGRNIGSLNTILPNAKKSIIEISPLAFEKVTKTYKLEQAFNGSILESNFSAASFDLVFSCGVMIHIHPDDLLANMQKMYNYSNRYILMSEYFNRTPTMIEYQGQKDKLFKRDFGKFFLENFKVKLVDYGFLWGHIYDVAGFDDLTWWVFEK